MRVPHPRPLPGGEGGVLTELMAGPLPFGEGTGVERVLVYRLESCCTSSFRKYEYTVEHWREGLFSAAQAFAAVNKSFGVAESQAATVQLKGSGRRRGEGRAAKGAGALASAGGTGRKIVAGRR
jgi:hypothetical protein